MVNRHVGRIDALITRLLEVIEEALEARLLRVGRNGAVVDLGPDHYARLTAVDRLIKLLTAGRPVPKSPLANPQSDGSD